MKYTSRLNTYLNQTATLEQYTDTPDAYGNLQYSTATNIKVRKEPATRSIINAHGETVAAKSVVFTADEIRAMDKIDGDIVLSVSGMVDKSGAVIGWEALVQ